MNRKTTGIIAILVCFLGGAAVGACGHAFWLKYKAENQERPIPYTLGDREGNIFIQKMEKELQLSQEQTKQLSEIGRKSRKDFKEFFAKNRPVMEGLVNNFESQISDILTEDQKARYFEFKKRQRKMMRMPPPPPPLPCNDHQRRGQFKPEKGKNLDRLFAHFDKDKDGYISLPESPRFLAKRFELIDENNDKKLSRKEVENSIKRKMINDFMNNRRFPAKELPPLPEQF